MTPSNLNISPSNLDVKFTFYLSLIPLLLVRAKCHVSTTHRRHCGPLSMTYQWVLDP